MFLVPASVVESEQEYRDSVNFNLENDDENKHEKRTVVIAGDPYDDYLQEIFSV